MPEHFTPYRPSDIGFIIVLALLLYLIWEYRAQPAQMQMVFFGQVAQDSNEPIEPGPWLDGPPAENPGPAPPPAPSLLSFFALPVPPIVLDAPLPLDLPDPPQVVVEQLPPIVMTKTCTRDNYYKGGRRYYHGKTHCTEPVPEPEQPPQ